MKHRLKVGAFIVRPDQDGLNKLLLFTHPDCPEAPIQIPGGSVEIGEEIEDALHREIREETGLLNLKIKRKLGVSKIPSMLDVDEILERHCFLLEATEEVEDEWIKTVEGTGIDEGLRFAFVWHTVTTDFTLPGDLGAFLTPDHIPELFKPEVEQGRKR